MSHLESRAVRAPERITATTNSMRRTFPIVAKYDNKHTYFNLVCIVIVARVCLKCGGYWASAHGGGDGIHVTTPLLCDPGTVVVLVLVLVVRVLWEGRGAVIAHVIAKSCTRRKTTAGDLGLPREFVV